MCGLSVAALNCETAYLTSFSRNKTNSQRRGRAIPCRLYAGVSGAAARLDGGQGRGGHSLSIGAGSVKQARLFARASSPRGVAGVRWALAAELTYATMHGRTLTARAFADTARLAASRSGVPVDARLKGYVNWLWTRHRANVKSGAFARGFAAVQATRGRASGRVRFAACRDRDRAALRFRRDGESLRQVAARLGCSLWAVRTASDREARRRAQERAKHQRAVERARGLRVGGTWCGPGLWARVMPRPGESVFRFKRRVGMSLCARRRALLDDPVALADGIKWASAQSGLSYGSEDTYKAAAAAIWMVRRGVIQTFRSWVPLRENTRLDVHNSRHVEQKRDAVVDSTRADKPGWLWDEARGSPGARRRPGAQRGPGTWTALADISGIRAQPAPCTTPVATPEQAAKHINDMRQLTSKRRRRAGPDG